MSQSKSADFYLFERKTSDWLSHLGLGGCQAVNQPVFSTVIFYRFLTVPILSEVPLTEINERAAESAEQDQTARMCRLILLYTLRK